MPEVRRSVRVLCTADLHIGRRSSLGLTDSGATFAAAEIWQTIVDAALAHRVDLVAIAGDVIDQNNRYLESITAFSRGLTRLAQANIPVMAVSGNHDWASLPQLVAGLDHGGLRLLGAGGAWEAAPLVIAGETRLWVWGWSFPDAMVETSPVRGLPLALGDGVPVLGLVHGDLDQARSVYAPLRLAELQSAPVSAWLLGHVHAPRLIEQGDLPVLYPGSPLALDAGEPGRHGAWLLEFVAGEAARFTLLPLSPVRYLTLTLDVSAVDSALALQSLLVQRLREQVAAEIAATAGDALRLVSFRVQLHGRVDHYHELATWSALPMADLAGEVEQVRYDVELLRNQTAPALDLAALARGNDPPGLLAQLLLALDDPAAAPDLRRDALAAVQRTYHQSPYRDLAGDPPPDAAAIAVTLREEGYRLLESLLRQKATVSA